METIFGFIAAPLGLILNLIYNSIAFHSYGLAIIILTLLIRLILLPLNIKQYRSMGKMQELQPQIMEIQKRYKNDKEKLNQELMKFYSENKYNPAGGCLPMLVQLPILFSLLYVIAKPLTYMLRKSAADIQSLLASVPVGERINGYYEQIGAVNFHHILNLNFFGMNLGLVPTYHIEQITGHPEYIPLLILPVLAVVSQFFSAKYSMAATNQQNANNPAAASMTNSMLYVAPLMTLLFSFQFPAGLSVYWITGNIIQIFQQMYMNKYIIKKKEVASK